MPVRKRSDSPYWQIHIGRATRFSSGTTDKAVAEEIERAERDRVFRLDRLGDRGAVPWSEAAERWLTSSARPKARDRWLLEWLQPMIGREAVRDVAEPDSLEELRKEGLAAGWSHATIDRMMGTVSAVLHACYEWRMLELEPVVPMYRPPRGEPRWLTPPQFEALCAELGMHQVLAARFAVHSLLRMRAMLKLRWDRVSFELRRAWVPATDQKGGHTFAFPLTDELVRILRALRWLSPPSSPWVFTWMGEPIDDCNTASFKDAVERAGAAPLRWHDLRHTGASWAVQSGVTLQELMLLGDWKDYRSVLRYAHLAPSQTVSAAEKAARWAHGQREAMRPEKVKKRN